MIILNGRFSDSNLDKWYFAENIIHSNLTPKMKEIKLHYGYEGLFHVVPRYFGMTKMYRNPGGWVTYEFTEEQWVLFLLRWA